MKREKFVFGFRDGFADFATGIAIKNSPYKRFPRKLKKAVKRRFQRVAEKAYSPNIRFPNRFIKTNWDYLTPEQS